MAKKTKKKNDNGHPDAQEAVDVQEQNKKEAAPADGQALDMPDAFHIEETVKVYQAGAYDHEELGLDQDTLLAMYRNMLLQRRFEERCVQMYRKQKISGFLHLYIGQEAVSTGAVQAIKLGEDSVITAYRDHGIALAMGMTANECMAELFGKKDGSSKGKGGSMHFFSKEKRMFGGHGIVGSHIPLGVGIAFAHKYQEDGGVCLTFFGDGAVGQGVMHEALNLAGLYKVPGLFIIENNQYAMGTRVDRAFADPELYKQAVPYAMPACVVNGMDVLTVIKAMQDHVELAREFQPALMEVRTYRYQGHSISDPANYRTRDELDKKKEEDPILQLKSYLLENDLSSNEELDEFDAEAKQEVLDSIEFAENSDLPDLEAIYEDVYVQKDYPFLN